MSLAVVGGLFPNEDGSNRLFEMAICLPGEPVALVPEPKNPADPSAVAVFSQRGIRLGYLSAERCGWIGGKLRQGDDIRAVFHYASSGVGVIRISFDGDAPSVPAPPVMPESVDADGFYPDEIPPDD